MPERSALQQRLYNDRLKFYDTHEKPKAGTWYTVPKDSWLDSISIATYGRDRTQDIINANAYLSSRPVHTGSGLPYIHPGDRLWLPPDGDALPDTVSASDPEEIAIRIDGKVYRGFESVGISRSIETCADTFSFVAPYDPDNPAHRILDPYSYRKCDLFIGGNLYIPGEMVKWSPDADNARMTIEVRSLPGVTVDCVSLDKGCDYNGMTLQAIATSILAPFGIIPSFPDGDSDVIVKANRGVTDTVFSFLAGLAKQKGLVITSTIRGEMAFVRAAVNSRPVASLEEGKFPLIKVSGSYDGTGRFSHYIAVSQSAGTEGNRAEEKDNTIKTYRPSIFTADECENGNIADAAKWRKSRALAAASPLTATVRGWADPSGAPWMENTKITLKAPRNCIFSPTEFIITSVEPKKSESDGNVVDLKLALPQAFTLDFPEVMPWQR